MSNLKKESKMQAVKNCNKSHGGHWFSTDTMKFFRCRLPKTVIAEKYFITSEQFDTNSPRLFTIRSIEWETGKIDTIGEFQQFESAKEAEKWLQNYLYNN